MSTKRLLSLDAFRGATIAFMILVNTPGSWNHVYPPLLHADWHGCSPTDLVFPFFLFIVGVSMWFSFKKFNSEHRKAAVPKTIRRTLLIFVIGFLLSAFPFYNKEIANLRIMGVLQRIALAYGFAALLVIFIRDIKKIAIAAIILLLGYWGLLVITGSDDPYALSTNAVRSFDRWLLGDNHLWQGKGIPFDPEGLLSTLPSIGHVLLGYLCGHWIDKSENKSTLVRNMIVVGVIAILIGIAWGFAFPINKSLWTSTFVVYTSGIATILLGIFIWLIDLKNIKSWAWPFLVFGSNSIFAYVLSSVLSTTLWTIPITNQAGEEASLYSYLFSDWFAPLAGNINGSLFFAITIVSICWLVTYILYRKNIFVKI